MNQPTIVLISGWAMPADVMAPLATALEKAHHSVVTLALPELARQAVNTADHKQDHWASLATHLHHQLPKHPVVLAGWSMGGMLASLYASQYPKKVSAVVNLATNACFVAQKDWPTAMAPEVFSTFAAGLEANAQKTLQQFTLLCSTGSVHRRQRAKELWEHVNTLTGQSTPFEPESLLLQSMLALLGRSDIRGVLADLRCPVVHLLGQNDALVPEDAAQALTHRFPNHRVTTLPGGHCFFMDAPDAVVSAIEQAGIAL